MTGQTPGSLFDLSGRVAVVTGASSGIGHAMAGALGRAGASVVLVARRPTVLEQYAEELRRNAINANHVVADLNDREAIPGLAKRCHAIFGRADILVNAAGVNLREEPGQITPESWDATLNLNLAVPFFFARELVPAMKQHGYGRIINIASLQSSRAFPNGLAYGASKGGVCQLTRAMAEAWSREGIMCNAIAPGFFPTDLTASFFDNPDTASWAAAQELTYRDEPPSPRNGESVVAIDAVGGRGSRQCAISAVRPGGVVMHIISADNDEKLHDGTFGDLSWLDERSLNSGSTAFKYLLGGRCESPKIVLRP